MRADITLSPDDARIEANKLKGQTAAGDDPSAERKSRAAEEQRKRASTLGRLLEEYKKVLPKRPKMRGAGVPSPSYVAEEIAQTGMALAEMNAVDMPAADLTETMILKMLNEAEGVTTARKRFAALGRFLDWAHMDRYILTNPCALIPRSRRPKSPQARSDYLEPADLARLWKAAASMDEPVWRDLVQFLIAVPCRRGEATALDWSHIDLKRAEWRQPDKLTKNRDPHRLLLHPLALGVLQSRLQAWAMAEAEGDPDRAQRLLKKGQPRSGLVFQSPRAGSEIDTFTRIKVALLDCIAPDDDAESHATLTNWTWHDFRRSFASALGEAGIPEAVADAILNHRQAATRGGVLGVYQRSSRWPEQVRAMELWGRLLAEAIEGKKAEGTVVSMARAE